MSEDLRGRLDAMELVDQRKNHTQSQSAVTIEIFSGLHKDWATWKTGFLKDMDRQDLSNTEKNRAMVQALETDTMEVIGAHDEQSFATIWSKLRNVYDNIHRFTIQEMDRILKARRLHSEDPQSLLDFCVTANSAVQAIHRVGVSTMEWGIPLVAATYGKMDKEMHRICISRLPQDEPPNFNELLCLLQEHAESLLEQQAKKTKPLDDAVKDKGKQAAARQVTIGLPTLSPTPGTSAGKRRNHPPSKCIICPSVHRLWNCPLFETLKLSEKKAILTENKLCKLCFFSDHSVEDCARNGCPRCSGRRHNSLICPKINPENAPEARTQYKRRFQDE